MPAPPTAEDLARTFGFTLEELALNWHGRLSRRQHLDLLAENAVALLFVACGGLGAYFLVTGGPGRDSRVVNQVRVVTSVLMILAGTGWGLAVLHVYAGQLVRTVEGPLRVQPCGALPESCLHVRATRLVIPPGNGTPPEAFSPGQFRVYYYATSLGINRLASIEPVTQ